MSVPEKHITLLAIESSCDETSAALCRDGKILWENDGPLREDQRGACGKGGIGGGRIDHPEWFAEIPGTGGRVLGILFHAVSDDLGVLPLHFDA